MIVTRRDGALSLVDQVEHGRIAGELARHWGNTSFSAPTPHNAVCNAATLHDEGWRAWDERVLFNELERRPQHFLEIDPAEHVRLYRHGVESVSLGDVYAGVLVGMHWTGLYRGRWSAPGARGRLTHTPGQEALRDKVVHAEERRWVDAKQRAWTEHEPRSVFETRLWHNYELLQFWDLLSLYLCVMPPEPGDDDDESPQPWGPQLSELEHRSQRVVFPQVRHHPFGSPIQVTASVSSPRTLTVDPSPFDPAGFDVEIEHRLIPDRPYSRTEVATTVRRTPAEPVFWRIQSRSSHG
jgi:hypothetical protein